MSQRKYVTGLSAEEKAERRREQNRQSQLRFRETHGLIKPKLTEEERVQRRKEKARERYLKNRPERTEPQSYTIEYQRAYHRQYYENNKDELLSKAKIRYSQKKSGSEGELKENDDKK
jgi:hypothetical protein